MPSLPPEMIGVCAPFVQLFSARVWLHAQVLALGAILASGERTVSSCLRGMELAWEGHFTNYQRVLTSKTTTTTQVGETPTEDEGEGRGDADVVAPVEAITDGLGRPVPEALDPAFQLGGAGFDAIRHKVIAARTLWKELQAELEPHSWLSRNPYYTLPLPAYLPTAPPQTSSVIEKPERWKASSRQVRTRAQSFNPVEHAFARIFSPPIRPPPLLEEGLAQLYSPPRHRDFASQRSQQSHSSRT